MKKNKTLSIALAISGIWLAFATIFMGFGPGAGYGDFVFNADSKTYLDIPLFDYIFNKGIVSYELAKMGVNTSHRIVLLVGFIVAILALVALVTLLVLRLNGKGSKKLQLGLGIFAIVMLVYYAISAFLTKQIFMADIPAEGIEEMKELVKLGAGSIMIGIFGLLGAGSVVGSILTNPEK